MRRRHFNGLRVGLMGALLAGMMTSAADVAVPTPTSPAAGPPPLPVPRSPVDFFRELLTMTPAEQRAALTNRAPEVRERLLAKVREYAQMSPDLAEIRLRVTELRWYLLPLMKVPPAGREALTAAVPEHLRRLVADRLERWDLLPPGAQRELLDNELALDYFTQAGAPNADQQRRLLESLPPARRQQLEADLHRWEALPAGERQALFERVNQFFDLTPKEQERVKATLSASERAQMEQSLSAFARLPREQRVQCIRAFAKLAKLSADERRQFLQDASRWSAMSSAERARWRQLVRQLPEMPPLPPNFYGSPPPLPPMAPARPTLVATNGR